MLFSLTLIRKLFFLLLSAECLGTIITSSAASTPFNVSLSDEKRLIKRLLNNYEDAGVIGRPVLDTRDKVEVAFSIGLVQILDLDEKNQVLTINVWSTYKWKDQLLTWEPADYGNVTKVRVTQDKIWTPDIVLYNYADERLVEHREVMCLVTYDGHVDWIPPAIFKSSCKIDITNFPFDQQVCWLKFGSWTYDADKLDIRFLNEAAIDTSDYTPSNEWEIIGKPGKRNQKKYECCEEIYTDLTFFLALRRNSAFFAYLLVLPCVLLSSLTLVIFWLPPESPAKMILGMNIFVAFFLLLLLLADSTPSASTSVPYIGYYYCLNMILITLSTFLSVIVINLYFRGDYRDRIPTCLHVCMTMIAKVLCMSLDNGRNESERLRLIKSEIRNNRKHCQKQQLYLQQQQQLSQFGWSFKSDFLQPLQPEYEGNLLLMDNQPLLLNGRNNGSYIQSPRPTLHSSLHRKFSSVHRETCPLSFVDSHRNSMVQFHLSESMEADLREIRRVLASLVTRSTTKDQKNRIAGEWRMVALVMDRLFFFSYLFVIIVAGLALLLPKDPTKNLDEVMREYSKGYLNSTT